LPLKAAAGGVLTAADSTVIAFRLAEMEDVLAAPRANR